MILVFIFYNFKLIIGVTIIITVVFLIPTIKSSWSEECWFCKHVSDLLKEEEIGHLFNRQQQAEGHGPVEHKNNL